MIEDLFQNNFSNIAFLDKFFVKLNRQRVAFCYICKWLDIFEHGIILTI